MVGGNCATESLVKPSRWFHTNQIPSTGADSRTTVIAPASASSVFLNILISSTVSGLSLNFLKIEKKKCLFVSLDVIKDWIRNSCCFLYALIFCFNY